MTVAAAAAAVAGLAVLTGHLSGSTEATRTQVLSVDASRSAQGVNFIFEVRNLPASALMHVGFNHGVVEADGGDAQAASGGIQTVAMLGHSLILVPTATGPLDGNVTDFLMVGSAPVEGSVTMPAGTSLTITNADTNQRVTLTGNGPFSLPSGVS